MGFKARCGKCGEIAGNVVNVDGGLLCARCAQIMSRPPVSYSPSQNDQKMRFQAPFQGSNPPISPELAMDSGVAQPGSGFGHVQQYGERIAPSGYSVPAPSSSQVSTQDHFILNTLFNEDETLHTEFKACRPQNFDQAWATDMISRYICAFLNTDGGTLYYGIRDDHVVRGLQLDAHTRDQFRLGIDYCANRFQPEVASELMSVDFQPVYLSNGRVAKDLYVVLIRVKKGLPGIVYFTPFPEPKAWVKRQASVRELKAQALVAFITMKIQGRSEEPVAEAPRPQRDVGAKERVVWMYWDAGEGGWVEYPREVQEVLETRKRLDDVVQLNFRGFPTLFYMSALFETSNINKALHIEAKRLDLRPSPGPRWVSCLNNELYGFENEAVTALERALETGKEEVEVAMKDFTVLADLGRMRLTGDLPLLRMV